jgi:hypothetical protein
MTDTASHHSGRRTAPPALIWTRRFAARADQVGQARRFLAEALEGCPVIDDAVLCLSELASNSVLHSASRLPGGTFTVGVEVRHGDHVRVEVHDEGGPWAERPDINDGRLHGLAIVRALAADSGTDGNALTGWITWARIDWPAIRPALGDADHEGGGRR